MNRATSAYIEAMEATSPIPADEDNLIRSHFKPGYFPQVHCWLLCQKKSGRKKKLFDFLNLVAPQNPTHLNIYNQSKANANFMSRASESLQSNQSQTRSRTSYSMTRSSDLILHKSNCTIDFSPNCTQRPSTRRINRNRFSSPGCQMVFSECSDEPHNSEMTNNFSNGRSRSSIGNNPNYNSTPNFRRTCEAQDEKCSSLAQFYVKKLLQPHSAQSHLTIADGYFDLLQEISSWVEKKCNQFPVDDLRTHPTLSPIHQRNVNYMTDRTDHLTRQSGPPLPTGVTSKTVVNRQPWQTPKTSYTTFFDEAKNYRPEVSAPFPPIEQSSPFCQFPQSEERERKAPASKVILRQALDDKYTNRQYKNIFESKTCL